MCVVSLAGGFFLARAAYVQRTPEAFEPEYKSDEAEHADAKDDDAAPAKKTERRHAREAEKTDDHAGAKKDVKSSRHRLLDLGEDADQHSGVRPNGSPTSVFLRLT